MEVAFAARLLGACAVIAVVLFAIRAGAAFALRSPLRFRLRRGRPLLEILETASLPGAATLHVVRVAERYYVVGRSGTHIAALGEVPADDITASRALAAAHRHASVDGRHHPISADAGTDFRAAGGGTDFASAGAGTDFAMNVRARPHCG